MVKQIQFPFVTVAKVFDGLFLGDHVRQHDAIGTTFGVQHIVSQQIQDKTEADLRDIRLGGFLHSGLGVLPQSRSGSSAGGGVRIESRFDLADRKEMGNIAIRQMEASADLDQQIDHDLVPPAWRRHEYANSQPGRLLACRCRNDHSLIESSR